MNIALDYLYSFINYEKDSHYQYNSLYYNLERTKFLLKILGNPEKSMKIIHVAGTKGKGSVSMIMNRLLREQTLNIGIFLSPHIKRINERIVVNDSNISNKTFIDLLNRLKTVIDKLPLKKVPTTFEILTAMAVLYFKERNIDYGILETGMGGRFDSTNFCNPISTVITSVSYDHMDKLGNTIEDIAKEKAGIIKYNRPVVVGIQKYPIYHIFDQVAREKSSNIFKVEELCKYNIEIMDENGSKFSTNIDGIELNGIFTTLYGRHQIENIILDLLTLKVINLLPDEKTIKNSLKHLHFKTRFEIIKKMDRLFILDSAHNEESSRRLVEAIYDHFNGKSVISVIGIVKGKDIPGIIKNISSLSKKMIITNPITHKELETEKVYEIAKQYNYNALFIEQIDKAIKMAISESKNDEIILITGSFYTTSPARELIKGL